ncbi:uncharacterized protein MYCFIDRAFT_82975 [Pseudocercospora fijiensis CIRAD86]|uniref:F-box domain-containing protein n=1 Tax=Pseudocercospora fijiensis (strain CIRAD86) TaxID=383855 RepID=M3AK14_PSEFD|nr:uncharacterized protein MYCFIDRAFT_82975 [Pseudocercospora fijiensis CIRAD86]EME84916.1 hypothetical protein MYCFIDRAFT_82975 [Pseudocercospora fijiensis CIRAD86]
MTAVHRVLHIPELLELILLNLGTKDLLLSQRTTRAFQTTIQGSDPPVALHKIFGIRTGTVAYKEARRSRASSGRTRRCDMLKEYAYSRTLCNGAISAFSDSWDPGNVVESEALVVSRGWAAHDDRWLMRD